MSEFDPSKIKDECDKILNKLTKGKDEPKYYYQGMIFLVLEKFININFKEADYDAVYFYLGMRKEIMNYIHSRIAEHKMEMMEKHIEKFITKEKNKVEESQTTVN